MMEQMTYLVKAGTILSQAINALVCKGHPDMTLSTRAYLERETSERWGRFYRLAERVMGDGHCESAWIADCRFADDIKQIQASL